MPLPNKRKYFFSSSSDGEYDDNSTSSSSREKEELKLLFCNYIDRIASRNKKSKILHELSQSLLALPSLSKNKNPRLKKHAKKKQKTLDGSQSEEEGPSKKNNLKNFFRKRLSKIKMTYEDFSDTDTDGSNTFDVIPQKKCKESHSTGKAVSNDLNLNKISNKNVYIKKRSDKSKLMRKHFKNKIKKIFKRSDNSSEEMYPTKKSNVNQKFSTFSMSSSTSTPLQITSKNVPQSCQSPGSSPQESSPLNVISNEGKDCFKKAELVTPNFNNSSVKIANIKRKMKSISSEQNLRTSVSIDSNISELHYASKVEGGKNQASGDISNDVLPITNSNKMSFSGLNLIPLDDKLLPPGDEKDDDDDDDDDVRYRSSKSKHSLPNLQEGSSLRDNELKSGNLKNDESTKKKKKKVKDVENEDFDKTGSRRSRPRSRLRLRAKSRSSKRSCDDFHVSSSNINTKPQKKMKQSKGKRSPSRSHVSISYQSRSDKSRSPYSQRHSRSSRSQRRRSNRRSSTYSRKARPSQPRSHSRSTSRSDSRRAKSKTAAKNQLEVYSPRSYLSYGSPASYGRNAYSYCRNQNPSWQRQYREESKHKRPVMKRVRNFLSLDSSVEEVFSNSERNYDHKVHSRSRGTSSYSWEDGDDSVKGRRARHNKHSSRWSSNSRNSDNSIYSSPRLIDLDQQKTHKNINSGTGLQEEDDNIGKCFFKKKSCSKIRGRLRQCRHSDSSLSSSSKKKVIKVEDARVRKHTSIIRLEESYNAVENNLPLVKESQILYKSFNQQQKILSVDSKQAYPLKQGRKSEQSQESKDVSEKMVTCDRDRIHFKKSQNIVNNSEDKKTHGRDNSKDILGSHKDGDNDRLKPPFINKTAASSRLSKEGEASRAGMLEDNEAKILPKRAPVKISFRPNVIFKNISTFNILAEASIKLASSKFSQLYDKKTSNSKINSNKLDLSKIGDPSSPTEGVGLVNISDNLKPYGAIGTGGPGAIERSPKVLYKNNYGGGRWNEVDEEGEKKRVVLSRNIFKVSTNKNLTEGTQDSVETQQDPVKAKQDFKAYKDSVKAKQGPVKSTPDTKTNQGPQARRATSRLMSISSHSSFSSFSPSSYKGRHSRGRSGSSRRRWSKSSSRSQSRSSYPSYSSRRRRSYGRRRSYTCSRSPRKGRSYSRSYSRYHSSPSLNRSRWSYYSSRRRYGRRSWTRSRSRRRYRSYTRSSSRSRHAHYSSKRNRSSYYSNRSQSRSDSTRSSESQSYSKESREKSPSYRNRRDDDDDDRKKARDDDGSSSERGKTDDDDDDDRSVGNMDSKNDDDDDDEEEDGSRNDSNTEQDKEGHLIYKPGDVLSNRYEIVSTLGVGTFGKVIECKDLKNNNYRVAIKVIKNVQKYREAAEIEISILDKLATKDPKIESLCIRLLSSFDYDGHTCLSFQVMGLSVFDFLENNKYQPYKLEQVRHVGYQLVKAIKFLHDNNLTHTDLKPENVLFVNSDFTTVANEFENEDSPTPKTKQYHMLKQSDVRLIDFGSATYDEEHHTSIISTRQYRAIEVILELGWHNPCDIWSTGCILFEMYTGNTLFQTHSNLEHLAMMEAILGPLPETLIERSEKKKYFSSGSLKWDKHSKDGRYVTKTCKPFKSYMLRGEVDHHDLFDLMQDMLTYDPNSRVTAAHALKDRFFQKFNVGRK